MAFYDSASIINIPSGYKSGTLYSAKPTDGTGDLTVTRSGSTATRVNSSGLIERCITNLFLNSATLVTQSVTLVAQPYTISFYGTGSVVIGGTGSGTLTGTGASNRVSLTFTPTAGSVSFTVTGSATTAQLETGDIATNYIATTSAAVTTGPIANIPRLDYFGASCPQLLMENTRTNLFTYSQMFDNAIWVQSGTTVTKNLAISPDGYTNADSIIESSLNEVHKLTQSVSITTGNYYVISCFVKQGSGSRRLMLHMPAAVFTSDLYSNFNLSTGVITNSSASIVGKIENYGNGWYRCSAYAKSTVTASAAFGLFIKDNDTANATTYTGDGTSNMYFYGAQIEATNNTISINTVCTSYIPTISATVTRNLDTINKGTITSLIGQTEGTLFMYFKFNDIGYCSISLGTSLSSYNNRVSLGANGSRAVGIIQTSLGSSTITDTNVFSIGNYYKIAVAYKSGDCVLYVNGNSVGTSATTNIPANSGIYYSDVQPTARMEQNSILETLVFKTRLTNAELATLTTL